MERARQIQLRPLGDCVLIEEEPFVPYNEHIGLKHIIIPDQFQHGPKDRTPWGKVVSVGPACNGAIHKGDRVCWGKWAGARFDQGKKVLVLVREYDILGINVKP